MFSSSQRSIVIDLARVLALVSVTVRHAYNAAHPAILLSQDDVFTGSILNFYRFIGAGAVPLFFGLSGLLSARKLDDPGYPVKAYLIDKVRSLVIPFIVWNSLLLALVLVLNPTGWIDPMVSGGFYTNIGPSWSSYLSAISGIGRWPIVYQLWFMRDLILISLSAVFLCRYVPIIPFLPWLLFLTPLPLATSAGFFFLGYNVGHYYGRPVLPSGKSMVLYCVGWSGLGFAAYRGWGEIPPLLHPLGSAIFILFVAKMLSFSRFGVRLSCLGSATFFLYASHEPLLTAIHRLWSLSPLPQPPLAIFFILPPVTLALCYGFYRCAWHLCPGLTKWLSGGRLPDFPIRTRGNPLADFDKIRPHP